MEKLSRVFPKEFRGVERRKDLWVNRDLEQLVQDLRAEGALDSAGNFTLDAARAREKLAQRQQREAGLWLVKLIQAAHLWEASSLELRQERSCARAVFGLGARPLDIRPWLARLHDVEMMVDPLYGPLATAFQAALADGCGAVEVNLPEGPLRLSPAGIQGNWQNLEALGCLPLRFLYERREPWWNLLLHPRRGAENFLAATRKGGLALPLVDVDRFALNRTKTLERVLGEEANPVRLERLWLSNAPARELMLCPGLTRRRAILEEVNQRLCWRDDRAGCYLGLRQWRHQGDARLPQPSGSQQSWLNHLQRDGLHTPPPEAQGPELAVRGLLHWNPDSHVPACILPVRYGIVLEAVPFTSLPPGATIWFSSPEWRTDIHQKKVVHDQFFRDVSNWVGDQFDDMVREAEALLRDSDGLGGLRLALGRLNRGRFG